MPTGRGQTTGKCLACGHINWFFTWSWAGNGKARCAVCGKWVLYDHEAHHEYIEFYEDRICATKRVAWVRKRIAIEEGI